MPITSKLSGEWDIKLKSKIRDSQYAGLNRILFMKGLWATLFSIALVFAIRFMTQGRVASHIVGMFRLFTNMTVNEAEYIYWNTIGRNMNFLLCAVIIVCMFLLFWVLLRSYRKYFEQVIGGIEQIKGNESGDIVLSPELEAVEAKLNAVKNELLAREREARLAEQQKNELVVYLAHDIKTPLTSVIGYLNLLNDRQNLSDEQKAVFLSIALDKANRLELLVNEFFEITRYSLSTQVPEKSAVNLCYLFVQLIDELYPLFRLKGKTIINDVDENAVVWGDGEKLARAFNNILKNAISYSSEKSIIHISSKSMGSTVIIEISNEGTIPPEHQKCVFQKSFRADIARRTDTGGAGLGLAISKSIIELHSGTIEVRCNATHTIFAAQLPISAS